MLLQRHDLSDGGGHLRIGHCLQGVQAYARRSAWAYAQRRLGFGERFAQAEEAFACISLDGLGYLVGIKALELLQGLHSHFLSVSPE
ncbi:hypothetical protein D3C72_2005590 [compost metagenome]